jgi:hypothetical protein
MSQPAQNTEYFEIFTSDGNELSIEKDGFEWKIRLGRSHFHRLDSQRLAALRDWLNKNIAP